MAFIVETRGSSVLSYFRSERHERYVVSDKSLACDEIGCTWRGCPHHDHFWDPELTSRQGVIPYRRLVDESEPRDGPAGGGVGGCACCQMLREVVESVCRCMMHLPKSRSRHEVHACIELWIWTYGGDGREFDLKARWDCGAGFLYLRRRRVALGEGSPMEFVKIVSPPPLLTAESDGETHRDGLCSNVDLLRCRSWLDDCNRSHHGCVRHEALPLPSRLLLAGEGKVVLRETAEFPTSDTPYIALSYCWGGKDPAKTLRSNYQDRVRGMSVAALPRTYRQAIYLARQLGIDHLWIDALCIVQDDNEDWQRESSRMADIFSGAYIVFVAAAAADVEGGLDPSADLKNCRYLTEHQVKAGSMWVRFKEHHFDACALLPISTRAWTYQERRLAKRCLIFGESEVIWECMQGCRCPCSATHTVARQSDPQLLPPVLSSGTGRKHFANSQDAYKFWSRAVQVFSKMQLTRPTDRLPAISAIASVIQAETGDQYLAGFWRSGLLKQLAWRCSDSGQIMNPPYDVYVAPSWSWLSLPRTVEVPEAGKSLEDKTQEACAEAEILHVHCEPVSLCSPLGAVQHGTLTLRGFCVWVKVQLNFWPGEDSCDKLSTISNKSEFHLVRLALDYDGKIADAIHDPPPQRPREMHAMPGARAEKSEVLDTAVKLLHLTGDFFLVLSHSRRERGKYVRAGTFSLHHDLINRDKAYRANVRKHLLGAANLEKVVVI